MRDYSVRVLLVVVAVLSAGWRASAQKHNLTITFTKKTAGSKVLAECVAKMSGHNKHLTGDIFHQSPRRGEDFKWTLKNKNCDDFKPTWVTLQFSSDLFEDRLLQGAGDFTIKKTVSSDSTKAPNGTHRYFILYKDLDAGDPDIDINGDYPLTLKSK